jgi:hypothetical protein
LADWLDISPQELAWFADAKGINPGETDSRLQHYRAWLVPKDNTAFRLIEAPKPRLRAIQHKILDEILAQIPAHPAAHGFVRGRNVLSFVSPHAKQTILLRFDLRDFFPSIRRSRLQAAFRSVGFLEPVAKVLSNLCTTWSPPSIAAKAGEVYLTRHLPQGAPTSPALANLCAYRLDSRLSGLTASAGGVYSRYADDLAFSGDEDFARQSLWLRYAVADIVRDEGFRINERKSKVLGRGQQQLAGGVVLNDGPGCPREERKLLEAILTNCAKLGMESQNRDNNSDFRAHLHGRICWVESINSSQGAKLRRIFDQIPT